MHVDEEYIKISDDYHLQILRQEIKRCLRYFRSTRDAEHLKDIARLLVYYTKKARAGTRTK